MFSIWIKYIGSLTTLLVGDTIIPGISVISEVSEQLFSTDVSNIFQHDCLPVEILESLMLGNQILASFGIMINELNK